MEPAPRAVETQAALVAPGDRRSFSRVSPLSGLGTESQLCAIIWVSRGPQSSREADEASCPFLPYRGWGGSHGCGWRTVRHGSEMTAVAPVGFRLSGLCWPEVPAVTWLGWLGARGHPRRPS